MNSYMLIFLAGLYILKQQTQPQKVKQQAQKPKTSIVLNVNNTNKKIQTLKKIGPYFPENTISIVNKSILITEKILKIYNTINFVKTNNNFNTISCAKVNNNKERINYLLSNLQQELPQKNLKNISTMINIITNYDKYKSIFSSLSNIISNPEFSKDMDSILKMAKTFMNKNKQNTEINKIESKNENENKDKMTEIFKILEMLKILDSPKKDPSN